MKRRAQLLGIAALTTVTALSAAVAYADTIVYPGLECVAGGEGYATYVELAPGFSVPLGIRYAGGNAVHVSSASIDLRCPIDRPNATDDDDMTSIFVRVDDQSRTDNVDCFVRSCNALGTTCVNSASVSSSGTGRQSLSIGSTSVFSSGYSYVVCEVPAATDTGRSGVLSYRITD